VLSLPLHPELSIESVERVADAILSTSIRALAPPLLFPVSVRVLEMPDTK
jgi:hypothetical protein